MSWMPHVTSLINDMSSRIGIIARLRHHLPVNQCAMLAQGLVMSKLRYCLSTFAYNRVDESDPRNILQDKIQIKLNDLIRLIIGVKRKDKVSISELSRPFPWASVNRLGIEAVILDAWKTLRYDHELADEFSNEYTRNTRSATQEILKPSSKHCGQFVTKAVKLLNTKEFESVKSITN